MAETGEGVSEHSQTVISIIGCHIGESAVMEGLPETAKRLSHALAEIAGMLEADGHRPSDYAVRQAVQKAKDTLKEWGVA